MVFVVFVFVVRWVSFLYVCMWYACMYERTSVLAFMETKWFLSGVLPDGSHLNPELSDLAAAVTRLRGGIPVSTS